MEELRSKLHRWANDVVIGDIDEEACPELNNDRARENWSALISVVRTISPEVEAKIQNAARVMGKFSEDLSEDANGDLLADLKPLILSSSTLKILPTEKILKHLNGLVDRPWRDYNKGAGVTGHWLARNMKHYGIKPGQCREEGEKSRGYDPKDFGPIFDQYLSDAS
jgi:hypothetical protein